MYADYAFYVGTFYGTSIPETDFPRLSTRASDFIDYYTRGRAAVVEDADDVTLIKKACCALAEAMQIDEQKRNIALQTMETAVADGYGELKSESVGSWSQSYTTAADYMRDSSTGSTSKSAEYAGILTQYLVNTGLLYRGAWSQ